MEYPSMEYQNCNGINHVPQSHGIELCLMYKNTESNFESNRFLAQNLEKVLRINL